MRRTVLFLGTVLLFTMVASFAFAEEKADTSKMQTVKINGIKEFNAEKFLKKT